MYAPAFNVGRLNERKGTATALNQHSVYQHTLYAPAFNVGRLNERKGTATALNQHSVYQHTLYAPAFNVGRLNERKGTIEDLAQSIDKAPEQDRGSNLTPLLNMAMRVNPHGQPHHP